MDKKLVVITGASSGIGEHIARVLSSQGYPLLLVARRLDRLLALNLPNTLCLGVDITDRDAFKAAIDQAEALYGPVDCLINNAGVMLLGYMDKQSPDEWQQMFNVNIIGLLNGVYLVIDGMKKRQHGTIINIGSVAGRKTLPAHVGYCGTKFAVHAMSENLREELANDNIRVIVIAPGATESELMSHTTDNEIKENSKKWKQQIGGLLDPDAVANAVSYAYNQPQKVCIREIVIAPTLQDS